MVPDEPPPGIADLFALERARLLELLTSIGDTDWDKPSPCPGWTALGLCCHLVGIDMASLSGRRDHHHGTPPPDGLTEPGFIAWLDDLQMQWVEAARRLSPRLVIDLLDWAGPQLLDAFRAQDGRSRSAHVSWAGHRDVPVWLDQVRELSEYWIHRQQLRQALDLPSDLRADLAGPILDGLRWAYPFRLNRVRATPGDTVSITISGPAAATWNLVATPVGWDFAADPGPQGVASLTLTTDQAWRLLTNNLPPDDQAGVELSGEREIVDVLRHTRAIVGSPK
jgi:uncharacterized protein (TIGR03083 family)